MIEDGGSSGKSSSSGESDVHAVLVPRNSPRDEDASDSRSTSGGPFGGGGWSGRPYFSHEGGSGISSRVSLGVHDCARGAWE